MFLLLWNKDLSPIHYLRFKADRLNLKFGEGLAKSDLVLVRSSLQSISLIRRLPLYEGCVAYCE